jgi:hypothetical protein
MINLTENIVSLSKSGEYKFFNKIKGCFKIIGFEAFIWTSSLIYLAFFSSPDHTHFTICPLKNVGINFCPGCGLGHSITQIFNGEFVQSFYTHPLGFFALIIISYRIFSLIKVNINHYKRQTS